MSSHGSANASASSSSVTAAAAATTTRRAAKRPPEHPEFVWYGLLVFFALVTIGNACYLAWATYRRHRARRGASRGSSTTAPPGGTGRLFLRRIPHAILSGLRIFGFRRRIPGIDLLNVEVVCSAVYMAGCLAWCFSPVDGPVYPANLAGANWGYRTGKLSVIQVPFVVLLSTKNNPITWLTGIGHEKLNLTHRVVSRCILLLTWLHFGGMYIRSVPKLLNADWKVAGAVGAVSQTITTLISIKWFRRRYYEIFYISHVILALLFMVTLHVHVTHGGFGKYIWGAWAIWLFDRLFRGGRYVFFNLILRPSRSTARIEAVGADGLRITLRRRIPGGWKAGQHAFLAFPTLALQSHPFTIGNIYEPGPSAEGKEAEMVFIIRAMQGQTRVLMDRAIADPTGSCELPAMIDGPYGHPEDLRPFSTCVFIAGGTGITYTLGRMHQLLRDVAASDACAERVVFVWAVRTQTEYEWVAADLKKIVAEAPSSISLAVDIYISGGSCSTDALRAIPALEKDFDADVEKGSTPSLSKRSSSSSSGPDTDSQDQERPPSPTSPTLVSHEGRVLKKPAAAYFTSPSASGNTTPTESKEAGADGAFPLAVSLRESNAHIRLRAGRPDVYRILEEEVTASHGPVAVDVSGPDALVDHVRSALCAPFAGPLATLKGTPTVMLSVEQFRM